MWEAGMAVDMHEACLVEHGPQNLGGHDERVGVRLELHVPCTCMQGMRLSHYTAGWGRRQQQHHPPQPSSCLPPPLAPRRHPSHPPVSRPTSNFAEKSLNFWLLMVLMGLVYTAREQCCCASASAYSATAVLPALVWAATNTCAPARARARGGGAAEQQSGGACSGMGPADISNRLMPGGTQGRLRARGGGGGGGGAPAASGVATAAGGTHRVTCLQVQDSFLLEGVQLKGELQGRLQQACGVGRGLR